jgi:hypothetical protein
MSLTRRTVIQLRVLLVAISLGFLGVAVRDHLSGVNAERWPTTEGRVLESYVVHGGGGDLFDTMTPIINYEYHVAGKKYVASTVQIGDYLPWAAARVKAYPQTRQVRVYYDPKNPQRAVLDPAYPLSAVVTFTVMGVISLLCALYIKAIHKFLLELLIPRAGKPGYGSDI